MDPTSSQSHTRWYEPDGVMSRVGATVAASLSTLLICLTISKAKAMVMLLFLLTVLLLIRFTLFPLREVPPCSVQPWRDSREFLALYALWVGWLAQSMLAHFADIHTSGLVEFFRSTGLVIVASMAWHSDQKPKTQMEGAAIVERQKQRVLLSVFWLLILPPLTQLGLLQTTPIISVLRVMIVFAAAVASDMKRKTYTRGQTPPEEFLELGEQKKTDSDLEPSVDAEFCRFLPLYVITFGWALFVPPLYWSGFLILSCISVWHFTKNLMLGKGMSAVDPPITPPPLEPPTPRRRAGAGGDKHTQLPPQHMAGQGRYGGRESRKRGRRVHKSSRNNFPPPVMSSSPPQESDNYLEDEYYHPSNGVPPTTLSPLPLPLSLPSQMGTPDYSAYPHQPVFDSRNTNGFHPYNDGGSTDQSDQRHEDTAAMRYETTTRKSKPKHKHVSFQESLQTSPNLPPSKTSREAPSVNTALPKEEHGPSLITTTTTATDSTHNHTSTATITDTSAPTASETSQHKPKQPETESSFPPYNIGFVG